jgi:hypothetical protein
MRRRAASAHHTICQCLTRGKTATPSVEPKVSPYELQSSDHRIADEAYY